MTHSMPKLALIGALSLGLSALVACAAEEAVSKADFEALTKQVAAKDQQVAAKDQQIAAKDKELAEAQQKLKDAQSVRTLVGAKALPTPTPAPPPTPLPAGTAPPPPRVAPAMYSEPVPFALYVETLATTSISKYGLASTVPCTPNATFKRGMKLVWRFEVYDMATGKRLIGNDGETVKIKLPNGDEVTPRFSQRSGGRVPDAAWMWGGGWDIPLDHPLGGLDYTITVTTKDGRTMTWKTPATSSPDSDSRVMIVS